MASYTVREWEKLACGKDVGQVPEHFADRLAALARRSPLAGSGGDGVLEQGRHHLRARGVVGILAASGCSLEILPKIEVSQAENACQQLAATRKCLIHMLAVAFDLKVDIGSITDLAWQRETLLEILVRIFCGKLTEAVRKGMPRAYVERTDDLRALRGGLDATRQFTQHAANPSRLACRFDELSEDSALNRIMKAAVAHLFNASRSAENRQRLRELAFVYADVAETSVTELRWDAVLLDRTNRRWQELLDMAQLFLQGRYQTTTGGASRGAAMLFEMNALFEAYVGRLITRALVGTDLSVSLQGGRLFCLSSETSGRGLFQTKPDILIRRAGSVIHVIDTKWKRISSQVDDPKRGVSQADVYQMMAYAQVYRAPRLTLLYPHHSGLGTDESVHARHRITGGEAILETASIDIARRETLLARIRKLVAPDQLGGDAAGSTADATVSVLNWSS
jgi:5-methylcytosine-specific restriction enzyme subunit McrC